MSDVRDERELVTAKRYRFEAVDRRQLAHDAEIRGVSCDGSGNLGAGVFLEVYVDVRIFRCERGERTGQELHDRGDVGEHSHVAAHSRGMTAHLVLELPRSLEQPTGTREQRMAGGCELDALAAAHDQLC